MSLSLTQRILGAFAAAALLLALNALYTAHALKELQAAAADEARIVRVAQVAYQLDAQVLRNIILLDAYAYRPDVRETRQLIAAGRASSMALRKELRTLTPSRPVLDALDAFDALQSERWRLADEILAAVDSNASLSEYDRLRARRQRLDEQARGHIRAILDAAEQSLAEATERDRKLSQRTREQLTVSALGTLAFLLLMALLLSRSLRLGLQPLVQQAQRLGEGDYSARVPVTGAIELDQVGASFNTMAASLGKLDQVKDEFLALASHQLRTPATGVKGNLGLLLEGYCGELSAEQTEVLRDAWQSNERQLAVIDDMLTVAKLEAGRMTLTRTSVDLAGMLQSVMAEQKSAVAGRGQTVTTQLPAQPVCIQADEARLRMVFENLLSNASKYTPTGGSIGITLDEGPRAVMVGITDTGVGIAAEDLPKLYKKFSRINNPLSRSVSGTGLGLYLVYEIVRLHGGSIIAESEPGRGTTFAVHLPGGNST